MKWNQSNQKLELKPTLICSKDSFAAAANRHSGKGATPQSHASEFLSFPVSLEEMVMVLLEDPDDKGEARCSVMLSAGCSSLALDHPVSPFKILLSIYPLFPAITSPPNHTFLFLVKMHEINFSWIPSLLPFEHFLLSTQRHMRILLPLCSRPPLAFPAAVLSRYLFPSQDTCIHCLFFIVVYETSAVYELFPLNAIIFLVLCSNKQL